MPKIFELLGYPVSDNSPQAVKSRKEALCPFMGAKCDGGGNRFMSEIDLARNPELEKFFRPLTSVPSGVCSIQINPTCAPWIICPRRLLYMGHLASTAVLRGATQKCLLEAGNFKAGDKVGIWAETKIKYSAPGEEPGNRSNFDYTFDYILGRLGRVALSSIALQTGLTIGQTEKQLLDSRYTLSQVEGTSYAEDFITGAPLIVEVMTSSTSGGNKKNRSCIPQAFEDCILGHTHEAPGINYRQVWARMASQMIVKSQTALAWGGKTVWLLQDHLAEYISSSTALDLRHFLSKYLDEVNLLTFSYGSGFMEAEKSHPLQLQPSALYAGPIRPRILLESVPSFQDIVLASVCPPKAVFVRTLCRKPLSNQLIL